MVLTVNQRVVGSSPTGGAKGQQQCWPFLFYPILSIVYFFFQILTIKFCSTALVRRFIRLKCEM